MARKRLIFTLLYHDGGFMLSRNFRLQRAGNLQWLKKNYDFRKIASSIDELIILDVSRSPRDPEKFCTHLKAIAGDCFVPIAAGGGIESLEHAARLVQSGADKLVVNSALERDPHLVKELVARYGSQCIIASLDVKEAPGGWEVYTGNGAAKGDLPLQAYLEQVLALGVGEIYLNSMDRDGTGHGYRLEMLHDIAATVGIPIILAGGAGNWRHLLEGLQQEGADAVATANLFNFIGQGFPNARAEILASGMDLAVWDSAAFAQLQGCLSRVAEPHPQQVGAAHAMS